MSLLECPSSQAEDLRKEIRSRIQAGQKREDIFSEVNQKYGNTLRMEPEKKGREALAYSIPWILVALSALSIGLFWNRQRKSKTLKPSEKANADTTAKILKDLETRS